MPAVLNFYIDDSGTRHPDRKTTDKEGGRDWFGLGGILIRESDEADARKKYEAFCNQWGLTYPLHSVDIRCKSKQFQWLNSLGQTEHKRFLGSLQKFLLSLPVQGLACAIDRPGYNHRYFPKYGRQRWSLCKTAFSIVVERAAKHAVQHGLKLRVMPERCNPKEDKWLADYYSDLKASAAPFDAKRSEKYSPLQAVNFKELLYEFKLKKKSSPMMQVADMYLWPICMGGYDTTNHAYKALVEAKRLVDCVCAPEDVAQLGVKYSCFDLVVRKT